MIKIRLINIKNSIIYGFICKNSFLSKVSLGKAGNIPYIVIEKGTKNKTLSWFKLEIIFEVEVGVPGIFGVLAFGEFERVALQVGPMQLDCGKKI